jgi:hypothetical protein
LVEVNQKLDFMFTLTDLAKLYANVKKAPAALSSNDDGLEGNSVKEKLSKLLFARESSTLYPVATSLATKIPVSQQKTIAICLVIVDCLHHEDIWKEWIEQGNSSSEYKARLFIHAKHPEKIKSNWVQNQCLPLSYMPEWNSPEVVRAMLATLDAALDDPECGRIVFGTESCLPIYNLNDTGKFLYNDNKSWLDAFSNGKDNWERNNCFLSVKDNVIPIRAVWKSIPGWIMLTRYHAAEINILTKQSLYLTKDKIVTANCTANKPLKGSIPEIPQSGILGTTSDADLVKAWGPGGTWSENTPGVWAPEEVFFPTMLALLGYLRKNNQNGGSTASTANDQVKRQMVTYATWKKKGDPNPIAYDNFTENMISDFRATGAVFGRKFNKDAVNVATWRTVISAVDAESKHNNMNNASSKALASSTSSSSSSKTSRKSVTSPVKSNPSKPAASASSSASVFGSTSSDNKSNMVETRKVVATADIPVPLSSSIPAFAPTQTPSNVKSTASTTISTSSKISKKRPREEGEEEED